MTHPFTPTYISMAKAAEEIQAMRPERGSFQDGDVFLRADRPNFIGEWRAHSYAPGQDTDADDTEWAQPEAWLPRLDQLLGMLGDYSYGVSRLVNELWGWYDTGDGAEHYGRAKDFHELFLMILMHEKYGKVWRDGKWEKV